MRLITRQAAVISTSFVLVACARETVAPAAMASNDPIRFFVGHTHGDAELDKLFNATKSVRVDGFGRELNGVFVLDQTTQEGSEPQRSRRWVMRKVSSDTYSGSLTDASGPVTIVVRANRAFVRYAIKGGLTVRQQLAVQNDGRTMLNQLSVTKFGIKVASLRETIHKLD